MSSESTPYLTIKQVAELLQVHENTARAYAMRGCFPAIRLNRKKVLFPRAAVEAWLQSNTQGAQ